MSKAETRRLVAATLMQELMHRAWFRGKFHGDANRYVPPLLAGVWLWSKLGRHLSIMEAFDCMQVKHGKTGNRYIELAEQNGFIERVDSSSDHRKTELRATNKLDAEMREETTRLVGLMDDAMDVLASPQSSKQADPNEKNNVHLALIGTLPQLSTPGWTPTAAAAAALQQGRF